METRNLSDIKIKSPYLRKSTDIDSLVTSIKTVGLIHPLTINKDNELLAGSRRYHALKELDYKEVPVMISDRNDLEQELISIDENLVRKPLNKIEFEQCLNRGREIYEKLNPSANKIDIEKKDPISPAEKKLEKEEDELDQNSFAAVTAEKLGVSKSIIKKAIKRDAKSSQQVKSARGAGEVSASQVNEIIRLSDDEQDSLLPYIKDKSVREVRKLVENVRSVGLDKAIDQSMEEKVLPKEFSQMSVQLKKCTKMMSKLVVENFDVDHPDMRKILNQVKSFQDLCIQFETQYDDSNATSSGFTEDTLQ
ncbi:ParB N-terminal domain-containing protein [Bacteriovoracaceae bacterium]|nr:ParB N-terminal domain-containing protein [Bacteriovoracaceae bacterium]